MLGTCLYRFDVAGIWELDKGSDDLLEFSPYQCFRRHLFAPVLKKTHSQQWQAGKPPPALTGGPHSCAKPSPRTAAPAAAAGHSPLRAARTQLKLRRPGDRHQHAGELPSAPVAAASA
jgi:hypothetical protein